MGDNSMTLSALDYRNHPEKIVYHSNFPRDKWVRDRIAEYPDTNLGSGGLRRWVTAKDLSTLHSDNSGTVINGNDEDYVRLWSNKFGFDHLFTMNSADGNNNTPKYKTNITNGYPGLLPSDTITSGGYDSLDQDEDNDITNTGNKNRETFMLAFRTGSDINSAHCLMKNGGSGSGNQFWIWDGKLWIGAWESSAQAGKLSLQSWSISTDTFYTCAYSLDCVDGDIIDFYLNGVKTQQAQIFGGTRGSYTGNPVIGGAGGTVCQNFENVTFQGDGAGTITATFSSAPRFLVLNDTDFECQVQDTTSYDNTSGGINFTKISDTVLTFPLSGNTATASESGTFITKTNHGRCWHYIHEIIEYNAWFPESVIQTFHQYFLRNWGEI
jgi:hypothetical protein